MMNEIAKKLNSVSLPGLQGGPLEHVIAAKAVALKEALDLPLRNTVKMLSRMLLPWLTFSINIQIFVLSQVALTITSSWLM